jgi:uncharacterized membrane protein YdjX (TVP38/TMEM64 family)
MGGRAKIGKHKKKIGLIFLCGTLILAVLLWQGGFLTFENIRDNEEELTRLAESHHTSAVLLFIAAYLTTAFAMPVAILLTMTGGFLFGTLWGAVYVNIGATAGATLAFLAARYFWGDWIQHRYRDQLRRFNGEMARHGPKYLFMLRLVPVIPFFVVNYLAGITRIPLRKYIAATFLGEIPPALVYAFAGHELGEIHSADDVFSPQLVLAFILLAVLAILPVVLQKLEKRK